MGCSVLPLFEMSRNASYRKKCPLGKRSHKSHVSGRVVVEIRSELAQHELSRDLFRAITRLPGFNGSMQASVAEPGKLSIGAVSAMEKALGVESPAPSPKGVTIDESRNTEHEIPATATATAECPWEERFDASTNYNYYFNKVTLVSQWEKPKDYDSLSVGTATTRDSTASQPPPNDVHPDLLTSDVAVKARTRSDISECVEQSAGGGNDDDDGNNDGKKGGSKRSTFVRLGSNLRMTLTWSGSRKSQLLKEEGESGEVADENDKDNDNNDNRDSSMDDGVVTHERSSASASIPDATKYV